MERNTKVVKFDLDFLHQVFNMKEHWKIVNVHYDPYQSYLNLFIEADEFEQLDYGQIVPQLTLWTNGVEARFQ